MRKPNKKRMMKKLKKLRSLIKEKSLQHGQDLHRVKEHGRKNDNALRDRCDRTLALYDRVVNIIKENSTNSILFPPVREEYENIPYRIAMHKNVNYLSMDMALGTTIPLELHYNVMEYLHTEFYKDSLSDRMHFIVRVRNPERGMSSRTAYMYDEDSFKYADASMIEYIAKDLHNHIKKEREKRKAF